MKMTFIAEVKMGSPWSPDPSVFPTFRERLACAVKLGDWIAVHTDPRWLGSYAHLKMAREMYPDSVILAKGFHNTDEEVACAIECGADYVLVVGRVPSRAWLPRCLIEPTSLDDLARIKVRSRGVQRVVWNSRNLTDGSVKRDTFEEARELWPGWLCQASNIATLADVHPRADGLLVGTHLDTFGPQWRKFHPR